MNNAGRLVVYIMRAPIERMGSAPTEAKIMVLGGRNSAEGSGSPYMLQYGMKEQCSMLTWKKATAALVCAVFFFAAGGTSLAVEMSLAGVRLSSDCRTVLKKYGNPTRVTVGTSAIPVSSWMPGMPGMLGMPGGVPGQGGMPGALAAPGSPPSLLGPLGAAGGYYAGQPTEGGGSTGLPGLPGLAMPGTGGPLMGPGLTPPGLPGIPGQQPAESTVSQQQVTWTYDQPDGTTVEFIISESGKVVQVTVAGAHPWALSKTARGIKLGSFYKDVIYKYGYPESHSNAGRFLRANYTDKHHVVFTLLWPSKKVVGITIALKTE